MKEITLEKIKKYNEEFNSNKWNKIISNAITTNGINNTCFNPSVLTTNQMYLVLNYQIVKEWIKKRVVVVGHLLV